jgi:renalase
MRIAVVGAGIAGVACARSLAEHGHAVTVLDRGRVPGGRMASRRFAGRYTDMGASYFTVSDPGFQAVVDDWAGRGLAREWTDTFAVWEGGALTDKSGPVRWAAPGGLRSLVADLATGLDVRYQVHVEQVGVGRVDDEQYDAVVLAMPEPQALAALDPDLTAVRAVLAHRAWDPVLVLAARWPERSWDWEGLFVHGSEVVEWVADDGARRGDGAPVLTAHSTPAFAATRLAVPADAAGALVEGLAALGIGAPEEVLRVQRWTYAKPVGTREEPYLLDGTLGFCGDGWGRSRVEGAWLSGTLLAQALSS